MGLVRCKTCSADVDSEAKTCPQCGRDRSSDIVWQKSVENVSGCGCLLACVLAFVAWGFKGCISSKQDAPERNSQSTDQERPTPKHQPADEQKSSNKGFVSGLKGWFSREDKEKRATEKAISAYARLDVPELQELLDKMTSEIEDRKKRLQQLEEVLTKVNKRSSEDADYKRWSDAVGMLERMKEDLLTHRNELYLSFRKFELAPSGPAASEGRSESIASAKKAVESSKKAFTAAMQKIEESP
ncbi:MAG: hypothetical protein NTY19_24095 [Planctomycetota bacterium]|nr:hypothetical protein [Planctomycetota bacterium]